MQYFSASPVLTRNVCGWRNPNVTSWKSFALQLWSLLLPALAMPLGGDGWGHMLLEPVSAYTRRVFRVTFFKQGSGSLVLLEHGGIPVPPEHLFRNRKIVRHPQSRETYKVREFREVGAIMIYLTVNTSKLSVSSSGRSAMLWNWQKIALNRDLKKKKKNHSQNTVYGPRHHLSAWATSICRWASCDLSP